MSGSTFRSTPVLVGVALTSLCFVATGSEFWPGVLLAGLVVPTGVRTYLVLGRRRAAGKPLTLQSSLGTLLASTVLTAVFGLWMVVVILMTLISKEFGLVILPLFSLAGLTIWLATLLDKRRTVSVVEPRPIEPDWDRLLRVRFTVRGMLVGVAFVAFTLWPVHLWRMRPINTVIARDEAFLAGLCEAELKLMAERAELCRRRASKGAAWDLDDEVSQDLKVRPYPDAPGHSWREQAAIWARGAEKCRLAAERHREKAARYAPWFGPSETR